MTKLETKQAIKDIIYHFSILNFPIEKVSVTIKASNDNILKLLADEWQCKIYEPFEFMDNNECRFFFLILDKDPRIMITIESKETYRKETILKPY